MIVPRVERDFFAIDRDFHAGRADGGADVVASLLHVEQLDGDLGAVAHRDLLGIPGVQVDDADERCFRRQGRLRPARVWRRVSLPRKDEKGAAYAEKAKSEVHGLPRFGRDGPSRRVVTVSSRAVKPDSPCLLQGVLHGVFL
jgi:hypothetical protein